jgi:8-oxo-dGTP pyrophosphatase MutT (NUDIX family)
MSITHIERLVRHVADHRARIESDPNLIESAVALVLSPGPDAILLIRRAERAEDPWSGQMGLPGGRRGPEDLDLLATAVRETREEVGVDLSVGRLIGALDDLAPRTPVLPPVKVRPYVFLLEERQAPIPNGEVASASWVPLADFLAPGAYGNYEVEARGLRFERPGYRLGDGLVWGMTERILTPVLGVLRG